MENKTAARDDRHKILEMFRSAKTRGDQEELDEARMMYSTWRAAYPESAAEEDRAREQVAAIKAEAANGFHTRPTVVAPAVVAPAAAPAEPEPQVACLCLRCGKTWYKRAPGRPHQCPRCKQTHWDTPPRPRKPPVDEDSELIKVALACARQDPELLAHVDRLRLALAERAARRGQVVAVEPVL